MPSSSTEDPSEEDLKYLLYHVFLPPQLPQDDDTAAEREIGLCRTVYNASRQFAKLLPQAQQKEWGRVVKMMKMLLKATKALDKDAVVQDILLLAEGESYIFPVRAQNAAVMIHCKEDVMVYSAFEVSPPPEAVMSVKGKLICSYPGPAVQIPLDVAQDRDFVVQLVSYLIHMDVDRLDAEEMIEKAGSKVLETRGTTHPRYISQLLMMILLGMGEGAEVKRVTKRIADEVCWHSALRPWRRSGLWFVIRLAIQLIAETRKTFKAFLIFYQTELLRFIIKTELPSELIHAARVKTGRRIYKLGEEGLSPRLMKAFQAACKRVKEHLQVRWNDEQVLQSDSPVYSHDSAAVEQSTVIKLNSSREYLEKVMRPDAHAHTAVEFTPSPVRRLRDVDDFTTLVGERMSAAIKDDALIALADFEWLVQERLDGWVMENSHDKAACKVLAECMDLYFTAASKHYANMPESQSISILTVMELWVAMDAVALNHVDGLSDYSPEVPVNFLDSLLLRQAKSIERAGKIQSYIHDRHKGVTIDTSIFSTELDGFSFGVRYFQSSPLMKELKTSIERSALQERETKKSELEEANKQHELLSERISQRSCEYVNIGVMNKHSRTCSRCKLLREARSMSIDIHEWPLSKQPYQAEAVCFELMCPEVFSIWRSRTYMILRDIGMAHVPIQAKWKPEVELEKYTGLEGRCKKGTSGRLGLGSETKPFVHTHHHILRIPAEEESVCLNNGLKWRLFDSERGENLVQDWKQQIKLDTYCTLKVPRAARGGGGEGDEGLYGHLQYAVAKTTHTHNETIVNQGDCPRNLSLHEQLAYSNLRCGGLLQWLNIARELRTNVLTFSREAVHTLLTQAAWQIGPLIFEREEGGNGGLWKRMWHRELEEVEFGLMLVREARELLRKVEANWMEGVTVKTIVYLVTRLLASLKDDDTHSQVLQDAYSLLFEARKVTHRWMREIVSKLQSALNDKEASELQRRACNVACTCRATYDVGPGPRLDAMFSTKEDLAVLMECAIVVHDNSPSDLSGKDAKSDSVERYPDHAKLLHRDKRLGLMLEEQVWKVLSGVGTGGLNKAIASVWSEYRRSSVKDGKGWKLVHKPNRELLVIETEPLEGQRAQKVHLNLLDGRLLVDGKPLGRLPKEMVDHATYKRIFGQKILDVIPADMPGMDYASRSLVHGYQIFFSLRDDAENLIIRARTPAGQIFELIPHTVLVKDFPTFFSTEYVHWMNLQTAEVEFRPLERLWEESHQNWRLLFCQDGRPAKMVLGTDKKSYLVDIRSRIFKGIAQRIEALETGQYLTMIFNVQKGITSVELPRLRLSFFVNEGELESKNMQGMVIDADQSTGTMIGLRSQLVLRYKDPAFAALPRSRCVLIPCGGVRHSITKDQHHVRVHIDTITKDHFTRQVSWYKYEIDSDLGYLVGNVSLTSRLYKIYLHALCSHPLPDPLTHQTGTDHALQELAAASCFSFQKLTEVDIKLLRLIGDLTPRRVYHPKHTKAMQKTTWLSNLPALSQHGGFDPAVCKILDYAQSLTIFNDPKDPTKVIPEYKSNADAYLMERAIRRNAFYYEASVDSEPAPKLDQTYKTRDLPHADKYEFGGIEAAKMSCLVFSWPIGFTRRLNSKNELIDAFIRWRNMSGSLANSSLEYKQEWQHHALHSRFLTLYDLCRQVKSVSKKFQLAFLFGFLAYTKPEFRKFLPVFLAFATMPSEAFPASPQHSSYNLSDGFEPTQDRVKNIIVDGTRELFDTPAADLAQEDNETYTNWYDRKLKYYRDHTKSRIKSAAEHLMAQAPSSNPSTPFSQDDDQHWFLAEHIKTQINAYFSSCSRNAALRKFADQVTVVLLANYVASPLTAASTSRFQFIPRLEINEDNVIGSLTLKALFARRHDAPLYMEHEFGTGAPTFPDLPYQPIGTDNLKALFSRFQRNKVSPLTVLYSKRLEKSRLELHGQGTPTSPNYLPEMDVCITYRDQCRAYRDAVWLSIHSALAPSDAAELVLEDSELWPQIHPRSILYPLASTSSITLDPEWKQVLIAYAEAFLEYQHAQRLVTFALHSEVDDFYKELRNTSFDKEDAEEHPDWLLIQIQGNFSIRALQSAVAAEMISPSSSTNTVLQLNMGEGKSHVIVPIVAVALADSHKLVRVVVLKPLASQMFHSLVERISGITNRRVFYLPFSRDVKMGVQQIKHIRNLFEECARVQGVLVTQPEHILSFRLMVIDRMLASSSPLDDVAQGLYEMQEWLRSTARDILDESDELLHVRYQLIYTMHEQQPLDDSPDRWIITQKVLDLLRRHMIDLQEEFPDEVELLEHREEEEEAVAGAFTQARLLGTTAARHLIARIAQDVIDGNIDSLNITGLTGRPRLRTALLHFIKKQHIDEQTYRTVERFYKGSGFWKGLLLLRGLLGHGILTHVLAKQRWRVDYGLDLSRSLLAVPYRAKDMPSLRSEFGHPDVAVCLTCLSYYYGGLNSSQVRDCFNLLLKLDNPPQEYEKWVKRGGTNIPMTLRQLIGINTQDAQNFLNTVVPIFRHNQATIDFFLSQVVFAKAAKEFPHKLGSSGWDLAEEPVGDNYITGFSGTNDNADLLPTSIMQNDPVNQLRTNAQVLGYLLMSENDRYVCAQDMYGRSCSAAEFLELLVREPKEVRVLLDVGAQMLELTNLELVKHWLLLRKDVAAGVFVNEEDRLSVLSQDGVVEPFYSSPFSQRLHQCVVYLDDAHTRGTDLKLPRDFRAVVTLGPKVTKDRLVQGCMRMRKLGHGQSVVFYTPPEIDRRIRKSENINASHPVKVVDVLSWVMAQTCIDIEHHIPHWVQQGVDYHNRRDAELGFSNSDMDDIELLQDAWLRPARRTLEEMYGIGNKTPQYDEAVDKIPAMHERLEMMGIKTVHDAEMEEEQEREVSHEVQQELQLERPPKVEPATHRLETDVKSLVKKGEMPPDSRCFMPLLKPLRSETEVLRPKNPWSGRLWCTRDFIRTTKLRKETNILSDYLRPVHWIISYTPQDSGELHFVVVSPPEANTLLPSIRKSKFVRLHMYAPRTIQAMKPMDDLLFYCIPPLPNSTLTAPSSPIGLNERCQLNIWAGQLYFDTYDTYVHLCFLLGISPNDDEGYKIVESDRFVRKRGRVGKMRDMCLFYRSPIGLVRMLVGMRRKEMSFENTHMGKVLHARVLLPRDFKQELEQEG